MDCLSCKIDNLYYSTIEHAITDYYDMGYPDGSSIPVTMKEDESGTFTIVATKKYGEFHIRIVKQPNGKYWLYVSPYIIKNVR
jgi:hypothetical protein